MEPLLVPFRDFFLSFSPTKHSIASRVKLKTPRFDWGKKKRANQTVGMGIVLQGAVWPNSLKPNGYILGFSYVFFF